MQKDWETQKENEENDKEQKEKEMTYGKLSRYGIDKISYAYRTLHIDSSSFINICISWVV